MTCTWVRRDAKGTPRLLTRGNASMAPPPLRWRRLRGKRGRVLDVLSLRHSSKGGERPLFNKPSLHEREPASTQTPFRAMGQHKVTKAGSGDEEETSEGGEKGRNRPKQPGRSKPCSRDPAARCTHRPREGRPSSHCPNEMRCGTCPLRGMDSESRSRMRAGDYEGKD